jgi:hypothetical protein
MFLCRSFQIYRASIAWKNSNVKHGIKLSQFVPACIDPRGLDARIWTLYISI